MKRQFLRLVGIRRWRRAAVVVVGLFCLLTFPLIKTWLSSQQRITSAISCKSKIAQMVMPGKEERERSLASMGKDLFDLEDQYYMFVEMETIQCYDQVRLGNEGDGGWEVCREPSYDIKPKCLVYSFGVDNDFSFEHGFEKIFGCDVFAFDPSMNKESQQISEKVHFYNWGLDHEDGFTNIGHWRMRRLTSIMQELKHVGKTIDYLKMDIEFSEWPALHDMIESGAIHAIRQLSVETHTPEMDLLLRPDHLCTWSTGESITFMLRTLAELRNAGFRLYYTSTNYRIHFNSGLTSKQRYCCHNLHFVNTKHPANKWKPSGV